VLGRPPPIPSPINLICAAQNVVINHEH